MFSNTRMVHDGFNREQHTVLELSVESRYLRIELDNYSALSERVTAENLVPPSR